MPSNTSPNYGSIKIHSVQQPTESSAGIILWHYENLKIAKNFHLCWLPQCIDMSLYILLITSHDSNIIFMYRVFRNVNTVVSDDNLLRHRTKNGDKGFHQITSFSGHISLISWSAWFIYLVSIGSLWHVILHDENFSTHIITTVK